MKDEREKKEDKRQTKDGTWTRNCLCLWLQCWWRQFLLFWRRRDTKDHNQEKKRSATVKQTQCVKNEDRNRTDERAKKTEPDTKHKVKKLPAGGATFCAGAGGAIFSLGTTGATFPTGAGEGGEGFGGGAEGFFSTGGDTWEVQDSRITTKTKKTMA